MFPRLLQSLALAAGIGLLLAACGPGAHTSPEAAPDAPAPSPGEERIIEEDLTRVLTPDAIPWSMTRSSCLPGRPGSWTIASR